VSIFVHKNLKFTDINLEDCCKVQVIEACAVQLEFTFLNFCILTLYRVPFGNFEQFLNRLETLNVLNSPEIVFVTHTRTH
jgi:hypothetical protein